MIHRKRMPLVTPALMLLFLSIGSAQDHASGREAEKLTRRNPPIELNWDILNGLDYSSGKLSPVLEAIKGKEVRIPGFMVPLEDDDMEVTEFLLVPYFGACVHVPTPPPNQMVYVKMQKGRQQKVVWWEAIWVSGKLEIEDFDSPFGGVGFQMTGTGIEPYKW